MKKYKIVIGGQILLMTKTEIENLDTSEMTNMDGMFRYALDFDGDISKWDITNVKSMNSMFMNCWHFIHNPPGWALTSKTTF